MKVKLFLLLMPFVLFSCRPKSTNLVSEKDKEIIQNEIKDVVNIIIKGCEEADFDMVMSQLQESSDFIYIMNGQTLSYQEVVEGIKPIFDLLLNQKVIILTEKIAVVDKSTVLYTSDCKFLMNFKDGKSVLLDPTAWFLLFRKIDNKWKAIYGVESYIEKPVKDKVSACN